MSWTERQRAMLEEMGVRLPPGAATAAALNGPQAGLPAAPSVERAAPEPPARAQPAPASPPAVGVPSSRPPAEAPVPVPAAVLHKADRALSQAPSAMAAMDWPTLQASVAACQACKLSESRRHTVFGVGNTQAHWMLVGEAPGEQEDLQGEPFVGKAGQLLDNMLRAVGLTRAEAAPAQQVYIANVLKCRPPGNRNPDPQEVARCQPYLQRQVELVRPHLILAMGRFAVQSLLGSAEPIGRLRGKVHEYQGVPVVVTYHPAYLLRNPLDKARSWEDLCLAAEVYERRLAAAAPAG
jgi:uracil-DNA glycosylase family 4